MNRTTDTIFQESWWLDTVSPNQWERIEYREGTELRAWMPIVKRPRALGITHFGMPPLTQTLGPWVQTVEGAEHKRIGRIQDYLGGLIERLPKCDYFMQNAHYGLSDTLPFHWAGYEAMVRYTYVLEKLTDEERLWSQMASRTRGSIRKARNLVTVRTVEDFDLFIDLYEKTFTRQGQEMPYKRALLNRVYERAMANDACRVLIAEDASNRAHAASFLLYDDRTTYYLMGGSDPEHRNSQALSLLIWEGIQFASTVSERFDFEGSMIPQIESYFRSFGAKQKTYYALSKMSHRFQIAWSARAALKGLKEKSVLK